MSEYRFEADDPYKLLAFYILSVYRPSDVLRMLDPKGDAYILSCIIKEVRGMDMRGGFIDCAIEDILAHKKRMVYMHELDKLAAFYADSLDKSRLRRELTIALEECGIEIPDDYSAGSVSSDNT